MMTVDGFFEDLNKEINWHDVDSQFNEIFFDGLRINLNKYGEKLLFPDFTDSYRL